MTAPAWDENVHWEDAAANYAVELAVHRALSAAGISTPAPAPPSISGLTAVVGGRPGSVVAGELIESAWGNAVRDWLPVPLGSASTPRGNVPADGSNVLVGTVFQSVNDTSTRTRTVLVTWTYSWSGGASPGRLDAYIKTPQGSVVVSSSRTIVTGEYGTMTIAGTYPAGPGSSYAGDLWLVLTGAGANVNVTGTVSAVAI